MNIRSSDSIKQIGKRLRFFRERTGMSQFDLEFAIDASPGSLSRIENGRVNPTKETLGKIAWELKLLPLERAYLLGTLNAEEPSKDDILRATSYFKPKLNKRNSYNYLLDEKSRVLELSEGFKNMAKKSNIDHSKFTGVHVSEILFDKQYGIRDIIPQSKFVQTAMPVLEVLALEKSFMFDEGWWKELMIRLERQPSFKELWNQVNNQINLSTYKTKETKVFFKLFGMIIEFTYITNFYPLDPRFALIEYFPKNKFLHFLNNILP